MEKSANPTYTINRGFCLTTVKFRSTLRMGIVMINGFPLSPSVDILNPANVSLNVSPSEPVPPLLIKLIKKGIEKISPKTIIIMIRVLKSILTDGLK